MKRWTVTPAQDVTLHADDLVLLLYRFDTQRRKAFVHPLHTAGGTLMTWNAPADHFWHHGLWFSWKYLDGVNYWEENPHDLGRAELDGAGDVKLEENVALVRTTYLYRPSYGEPVVREERAVTLHAPDDDGNIRLDWSHSFTALKAPVEIDRTPITDETPWGGYGGLSWRAAESMGGFRALDGEGRRDRDVQHRRARWADLSGGDGEGRMAGVTIFDHPANPRYPTHWKCFVDDGFGYLNAAFVLAEPYSVTAGEPLELRYRVLVHDGSGDAEKLEAEASRFARTDPSA